MPTRSWLALVWMTLLVLLPAVMPQAVPSEGPGRLARAAAAGASGAGVEAAVALPAEEATIVAADFAPLASDLRAPERVELLNALARVLAVGPGALPASSHRSGAAFAPPASSSATWCSLEQCRRQAGARLLRYATAPPTRS